KALTFCRPPQRADMLRTGTVRGPGAVSKCAHGASSRPALAHHQPTLLPTQELPVAGWQVPEFEILNLDANQSQRWVTDGRRHTAHLAVFPFNQFQTYPALRHVLPETNGPVTRRQFEPGIQQPRATRQGPE